MPVNSPHLVIGDTTRNIRLGLLKQIANEGRLSDQDHTQLVRLHELLGHLLKSYALFFHTLLNAILIDTANGSAQGYATLKRVCESEFGNSPNGIASRNEFLFNLKATLQSINLEHEPSYYRGLIGTLTRYAERLAPLKPIHITPEVFPVPPTSIESSSEFNSRDLALMCANENIVELRNGAEFETNNFNIVVGDLRLIFEEIFTKAVEDRPPNIETSALATYLWVWLSIKRNHPELEEQLPHIEEWKSLSYDEMLAQFIQITHAHAIRSEARMDHHKADNICNLINNLWMLEASYHQIRPLGLIGAIGLLENGSDIPGGLTSKIKTYESEVASTDHREGNRITLWHALILEAKIIIAMREETPDMGYAMQLFAQLPLEIKKYYPELLRIDKRIETTLNPPVELPIQELELEFVEG